MSFAAAEADRRLASLGRIANVTAIDAARARVRVTFGAGSESAWLPWLAPATGSVRVWAPPAVGEQVSILPIGGDTAQGVVLGSIFKAGEAPSDDAEAFVVERGAARIAVTDEAIVLSVGGTSLRLDAGGLSIVGQTSIEGATAIDGGLGVTGQSDFEGGLNIASGGLAVAGGGMTHNGTDVGSGHRHSGVESGGSNTGEPV